MNDGEHDENVSSWKVKNIFLDVYSFDTSKLFMKASYLTER